MMLRVLLLLRGTFNVLFGAFLLVWLETHALQGLGRGGFYALVDGLLGLVLGAALLQNPRGRWLALLALADGLVRVIIGALILGNPGMEKMVFGTTIFFTAVILACLVLGIGGVLYVLIGRRLEAGAAEHALVWPAVTISLFTLLLGAGLAFGFLDQERRVMLGAYATAMGLTLTLASRRLAHRTAQAA